ncbi:hypothetical protein BV22DRAFT_1047954 [Leucogyrophana mollusca]|uniref:Uncharacterized protein n=1 Tax=Leucogyrophana mollusca TaxID=85980 RepID=A0ACB8BEU5_9AGAM|nr:hypothetical protein BV22DRAFT_1047954 [Leucogyrophana mollusca]
MPSMFSPHLKLTSALHLPLRFELNSEHGSEYDTVRMLNDNVAKKLVSLKPANDILSMLTRVSTVVKVGELVKKNRRSTQPSPKLELQRCVDRMEKAIERKTAVSVTVVDRVSITEWIGVLDTSTGLLVRTAGQTSNVLADSDPAAQQQNSFPNNKTLSFEYLEPCLWRSLFEGNDVTQSHIPVPSKPIPNRGVSGTHQSDLTPIVLRDRTAPISACHPEISTLKPTRQCGDRDMVYQ